MPRRLVLATTLVALFAIPASASAQSTAGADGSDASADDRYSIVHGCFALRSQANGNYVAKSGSGYAASAGGLGGASPFRMQATDLGKYLLYDPDQEFLAATGPAITADAEPSNNSDWTVNESGDVFTFVNEHVGSNLAVAGNGDLVATGPPSNFILEAAEGCPEYPEVEVNASGSPSKGNPRYGEVMGTVEGHMHGMAFEFLGGRAHCGRPWHRFGAPYALVDCPDHETSGGCGAVMENILYGSPARCHNPGGWPDFSGWPDPKSLTHEQSYYKWIERAYMGGLRLYVNLMVENKVLCDVYPLKQNSCNEMDSVLLQIQRIHELEDYIDAQSGGPGEGWFRIVDDPFEAREVINDGKMAVVQGMEVSEPFNCSLEAPLNNPDPRCARGPVGEANISKWIDDLYDLGLRQFEITNKFDNALTGVAGDGGELGFVINGANFLSTGEFWDLDECEDPAYQDNTPTHIDDPTHNQDLIISNGLDAFLPGGTLPVYGPDENCNQRGLSELGEHAIRELMDHQMMFDPDHQSVIGRQQALELVEEEDYPGVFSSHSWSTDDATPRILGQGGVMTPSASNAPGFVHKYDHIQANLPPGGRQYHGLGYGADQNGFASQPGPRGADAPNPVTYPFQGLDPNVTLDQQVSGEKTYDFNVEGVAHYGMYPDLWEDIRDEEGGQETYDALARGAEAYLQMWERVEGIEEVRCDTWNQPRIKKRGFGEQLKIGYRSDRALEEAGQPEKRKRAWRWCGNEDDGSEDVYGVFNKRGKLGLILTTKPEQTAGGIGAGDPVSDLRGKARRVNRRLWIRGGGKRKFVYVVAGGEVVAAGAVSRKIVRSNKRLRRNVRLAGLP